MSRKSLIDSQFSRVMLGGVTRVVKRHFPDIHLFKEASVYHFHRDSWEFHGPDKFYWHGRAGNAHDARTKGWTAWLKTKGIDA